MSTQVVQFARPHAMRSPMSEMPHEPSTEGDEDFLIARIDHQRFNRRIAQVPNAPQLDPLTEGGAKGKVGNWRLRGKPFCGRRGNRWAK
jgi:hypothetical protein